MSLASLEMGLDSIALEAHIRHCRACGIVHELVALRRDASVARERRAECARIEDLIAARAAARIGIAAEQQVLAGCAECRAIAAGLW